MAELSEKAQNLENMLQVVVEPEVVADLRQQLRQLKQEMSDWSAAQRQGQPAVGAEDADFAAAMVLQREEEAKVAGQHTAPDDDEASIATARDLQRQCDEEAVRKLEEDEMQQHLREEDERRMRARAVALKQQLAAAKARQEAAEKARREMEEKVAQAQAAAAERARREAEERAEAEREEAAREQAAKQAVADKAREAAAAAHAAAVKERARRAAALAVAFRARRAGYAGQLADAWRTYGWTAVGTHFAVYGTTLAGLTAAVDVGLLGGGRARDEAVAKLSALVAPVAPRALVDGLRSSPTAGAFAVAWVLAKFTEIPRLAVTLALTPRVAAMRSVVRLAVRGVVS